MSRMTYRDNNLPGEFTTYIYRVLNNTMCFPGEALESFSLRILPGEFTLCI